MKKNINLYFLLAVFFAWGACRKAEGPTMNYAVNVPDSLQLTTNQKTVNASWQYSPDSKTKDFVVVLAADEDFKTILESDTLSTDARKVSFKGIDYKNAYYFRILAEAKNPAQSTGFVSTKLLLDNLFLPIKLFDITSRSVNLSWD